MFALLVSCQLVKFLSSERLKMLNRLVSRSMLTFKKVLDRLQLLYAKGSDMSQSARLDEISLRFPSCSLCMSNARERGINHESFLRVFTRTLNGLGLRFRASQSGAQQTCRPTALAGMIVNCRSPGERLNYRRD